MKMPANCEVVGTLMTNISDGDVLMDEVKINLNMLGVLMLDDIGGEIDRAGRQGCLATWDCATPEPADGAITSLPRHATSPEHLNGR
jgi:hypothetical protein